MQWTKVLPQPVVCEKPPLLTKRELREIIWHPLQGGPDNRYLMCTAAAGYKNLAYDWNGLVVAIQERTAYARHFLECIARHNRDLATQATQAE